MPDLVGIINISINPVLIDTGGFELTWHGLFTAVGIALGVWLAVRPGAARADLRGRRDVESRSSRCSPGSSGRGCSGCWSTPTRSARVGDIFALTDGGISIYGRDDRRRARRLHLRDAVQSRISPSGWRLMSPRRG